MVVGRSGTVGSWDGTPRGGARWTCGYYAFDLDPSDSDGGLADIRYDDGPVDPEPGQAYVLACYDESGNQVKSLLQQFDPADPLAGIAATERALDEARRRLDLPLPEPAVNPPGAQLVGVATWLWVDGPWAAPLGDGIRRGRSSATVTARPDHVVWDLGDGTTLTCDAGTPYDTSRAPGRAGRATAPTSSPASSAALPDGTYAVTVDHRLRRDMVGDDRCGWLARSAGAQYHACRCG